MTFTSLHRHLGLAAGPVTDAMVDDAVEQGLSESDDLDWKWELPPAKGLPLTDFPKDIAAMANRGGGTIVFGVTEDQKVAVRRTDAGELTEGHERALRSAAVTAISPPVLNLEIYQLGKPGARAVVVVVPAGTHTPHLLYRGELFGAPVRNDADTVWMREAQIETMYRARFDERRHATEALDNLYLEAAAGRDAEIRAWIVAVAHPRHPTTPTSRPSRDDARRIFQATIRSALQLAGRGGVHPLESVDLANPRPGLRRWVAPNTATTAKARWKESWASVHDDGSASIVAAVGGHRSGADEFFPGDRVQSRAIECAVADLMALVRTAAAEGSPAEYEVRVGIEWRGDDPLVIQTVDQHGFVYDGHSIPLARYSPVDVTVRVDVDDDGFLEQVHDLALDCVNQGGISELQLIRGGSGHR